MEKILLILCFIYLNIFDLKSQDTVHVVSYNLLRYNSSIERNNDFKKIFNLLKPDIILAQEIVGQEGVTNLLDNVLKEVKSNYEAGEFIDDPNTDIDQGLFYNSDKFEFLSSSSLDGYPRPIYIFNLKHKETGENFVIYNLHLKASKGGDNENMRRDQIIELKNYISEQNDNFYIVGGDFNIYSTTESAYQSLFDITESGKGNLHDIINVTGTYNDPLYAKIHTQSTRTTQFGGGSHGGLDDRFDFILYSDSVMYGDRIFVIDSTYKAVGNDGLHYNSALNILPNESVSSNISNALHDASDHLPVSVKIIFSKEKIFREVLNVESYKQGKDLKIYPNPTFDKLNIKSKEENIINIQLISPDGKDIRNIDVNSKDYIMDLINVSSGIYFLKLEFKNFDKKIRLIKK